MSSRYTKQHYEDVATILREAKRIETDIGRLIPSEGYADEFADLFAIDNPLRCIICGDVGTRFCEVPGMEHTFEDGFDREGFFAACGLETAQCPK